MEETKIWEDVEKDIAKPINSMKVAIHVKEVEANIIILDSMGSFKPLPYREENW